MANSQVTFERPGARNGNGSVNGVQTATMGSAGPPHVDRLGVLWAGRWILVISAVLAFVAWKLYERRWLVRHYSVARVEIAELERLLTAEPPEVLVIDLRSEQAFSGSAQMVRGARRIPPGEFERHINTMPADKEIILYCT